MPDQATTGLEEPLLETRQRPALIVRGRPSRRRRLPRLEAMTPRSNRTSLARNGWQESRVQWVAAIGHMDHHAAQAAAGTGHRATADAGPPTLDQAVDRSMERRGPAHRVRASSATS